MLDTVFCNKCLTEVNADEYIVHACMCRSCRNKYQLRWYYKNRERVNNERKIKRKQNRQEENKKARIYYYENKEQISANNKRYRKKNKEQIKIRRQKYYIKNKKSLSEKAHIYYEENKMSIRERCKSYYTENKEKILAKYSQPKTLFNAMKSKAKQRKIMFDLSFEDFSRLISCKCFYCGKKVGRSGIDRIDSSLGYTLDNCVSACIICNTSKMDSVFKDWLIKMKKIVARAEQGYFDHLI